MDFRGSRRGSLAAIITLLLSGLAVTLTGLAACGADGGTAAGSSSPTPSVAAAGPITLNDDAGKPVTLKSPATRVVSLAPANTEMAYAAGGGSKMVAGTSYDDYPAAAKALHDLNVRLMAENEQVRHDLEALVETRTAQLAAIATPAARATIQSKTHPISG